jgi:putative endonuclease
MQVRTARLCLDCEELHPDQQCPNCASEAFVYLSRWIAIEERRKRQRPPPQMTPCRRPGGQENVRPLPEQLLTPNSQVREETKSKGQSPTIHVVPFVYILRCADGTLYTGYARDPKQREQAHNNGRGAKYTAGRRPVRLVYSEAYRSVSQALKREHQLKRWTRTKKETLIAGDVAKRRVRSRRKLRG